MPHAVWTPLAEAELEDIVYHIAIEGGRPLTAERIAQEIRDRANWFAASAEVGHRNPDFPPGWLYFLHKRWLVLYQGHE
jgi:plasmid stabilization system protein ParE